MGNENGKQVDALEALIEQRVAAALKEREPAHMQAKVVELRTAHHDELQAVDNVIAGAVDNVIAKVNASKLSTAEKTEVVADLETLKPATMQATTRAMSHLNQHLPNRSDV